MTKRLFPLTLVFLWLSASAHAKHPSVLKLAEDYDFHQKEVVGIEVELTGLQPREVADILVQRLHGQLNEVEVWEEGEDTQGRHVRFKVLKYEIKNSLIGNIEVKPEDNSFDEASFMESRGITHTVEIVSSPLDEGEALRLGRALWVVKQKGGVGTHENNAVSLQVNVQIVGERRPKKVPRYLLKLLRDYYEADNYNLLMGHFDLPEIRKTYIGKPSTGLLQKINDPLYRPTIRRFYDDVMYRQTYEFITKDPLKAQTLPLPEIKTTVLNELTEKGLTESILRSFKWNDIKLTALLIYWFPNDPLSQKLIQTTWFRGYPAIEFRAPNNDFRLKATMGEILSLIKAARATEPLRLRALTTVAPSSCESQLSGL
jgi:hypothetical protein